MQINQVKLMKYVKIDKFFHGWDKDPEWMLVNKAGRVVKVDNWYTKEMLEKEIEQNIKIFRYLAQYKESAKWLQVKEQKEIPDDLFQVVPYDEQKCIEQGFIELSTEEEYNKIFYPRGKVE